MTKAETLPADWKARSVWSDPVFWFVIALGLGYGSVYNILPTSFPIFRREFGATLEQMGRSQLLFFSSGLLFSLVGGAMVGHIGLRRSAMVGLSIAGAALLFITTAAKFNLVLASALFFGFSISGLVVIGSSIISNHFVENRQSVFFLTGLSDAGGSMIGPAALGWWFVQAEHWQMSWRGGYYAGAGVMAILLVWALCMRSSSMGGGGSQSGAGAAAFSVMKDILSDPIIYVTSLLGFFHGLAQAGMISFVGQLYQSRLHIDAARAALFLSFNAGGILGGRLLFSAITSRWKIPELMVITFCAAGETMAFLATIICPIYLVGILLFTLSGVFVSTIGPSLSSYLGGRFVGQTAMAFALFAGLSNVGAAVGAYFVGAIGNHLGVGEGICIAPMFSAVLSLLAYVWFVREKRKLVGASTVAVVS